jgi:hypothetical protein
VDARGGLASALASSIVPSLQGFSDIQILLSDFVAVNFTNSSST